MERNKLSLAVTGILLLSVVQLYGQSTATLETSAPPRSTRIFTAPDETSPPAGFLVDGESVTTIAESTGTGISKWYLVKTKSGITGWIKQDDSDQSRKSDLFFRSMPRDSASLAVPIPTISVTSAAHDAIIVPVQFIGRAAIISVTLNRTVNGNLLLDTGATNTVISRRLSNRLSLRTVGNIIAQTVGGTITAPVARLSSLKVGEAEVNDLSVTVHDFSQDPRIEGLLGMDFLGRYQIGLDAQKRVLVLTPR